MTSRIRGCAIIVNIVDSENDPKREGSDVDAENLQHLYEQLGFTVHMWTNYKWEVYLLLLH